MNIDREIKTPLVLPGDSAEAAALFSEFSARKREGGDVRVRLVDSPFEAPAPGGTMTNTADVSAAGMDRITEISKGDLLAVCGGGVKLADLRREVSRLGLFFPFDPELASADVTLAQVIMGGEVSRYEGKYGRLREYILSLGLVTGAGDIIRTGTRSVKNVAGYEVTAFATGGGSRCGLVCSVTLRLLPAPEAVGIVSLPGAYRMLLEHDTGLSRKADTASVELFRGDMTDILLGREAAGMGVPEGPDGALLIVETHGEPSGEGHALLDLRRSLVDRLAAERDREYIARDINRPFTAGTPPTGGWVSFHPDREVIVYEPGKGSGTGKSSTAGAASRIAAGPIGRAEKRPLVRKRRRNISGGEEILAISGRLDDLFDPEGIFVKD